MSTRLRLSRDGIVVLACVLAASGLRADQVDQAEEQGVPDAAVAGIAPAQSVTGPAARAAALARLRGEGLILVVLGDQRVAALDPVTGDVVDDSFVPSDPDNLGTPINAILSPDGEHILVSDQIRDGVFAYTLSDGGFAGLFAPAGGVDTSIADNLRGISLTPDGDLLVTVADGANSPSVTRFDSAGNHLGQFIAAGTVGNSPFDVHRIEQTAGPLMQGEYIVPNGINGGVVRRFDSNGQYIADFATAGAFAQQAKQAANGNILVAAFSNSTSEGLYEFAPDGTELARLDPAGYGGYRGIHELPSGHLLTTTGAGVHEFTRDGQVVRDIVTGVGGRFIEFVQLSGDPPAGSADLGLSVFDLPDPVAAAGSLSFIVQVGNFGPHTGSGIEVQLQLPDELQFSHGQVRAGGPADALGGGWSCTYTAATVLCSLSGSLAGSALAPALEIVTSVDAGAGTGIVTTSATVAGAQDDPVPGNNAVVVSTEIIGVDDVIFADGFESQAPLVCGWDTALGDPGGSLGSLGLWRDQLYVGPSLAGPFGGVDNGVARIDLGTGAVLPLASTELVDGFVNAFVPYDTGDGEKLYLIGAFNGVRFGGGELPDSRSLVAWDGSVTQAVPGSPFAQPLTFAQAGTTWNDELVVGGSSGAVDPPQKPLLALWDGAEWATWHEEFEGLVAPVILATAVFDGDLYFAGRFDRIRLPGADGEVVIESKNIMGHDGMDFFSVGGGAERSGNPVSQVLALATFDDGSGEALYLGGRFNQSVTGVPMFAVAKWDGVALSAVGAGFPIPNDVRGLEVYDDGTGPALYATGTFTADTTGAPIRRFARLVAGEWQEVAGGTGENPGPMQPLPDGSLAVGGSFIEVGLPGEVPGSGPAIGLAQWLCLPEE